MSKKFLFLLCIFLSLISLISAADIAYVVKTAPDANIINAITEAGYDYELIYDSKIPSTNFSNYKMILVWDESLPNYSKIPITQKKSLVGSGKSNYLDYWGIADYVNNLGSNNYESGIILLEHEITGDLKGTVPLYNHRDAKIYVLPLSAKKRALGLKRLVSTIYDRAVIGAIDSGGKLYGDAVAKERIVFFGITETEFWTQESKKLFKNSLKWLIGVNSDGDSYYSDKDCNDQNPNVWRKLNGYRDSDNDGYGTGNIVEVCSGNTLPVGYSLINSDCNDNNADINPNATELLDDTDQNCVNDAPVFIGKINDISWDENESLEDYLDLNDYFKDPDGDELEFGIDDTSENENITVHISDGLVSFESAESWSGEDWLIFKAVDSEGKKVISNKIILKVLESEEEENEEEENQALLTCSQKGGHICNSEQTCSGSYLIASDSQRCCPVACQNKEILNFGEINRKNKTDKMQVEILDIGENEEFLAGEKIEIKTEIWNKADKNLDFDLEVYLYDLTENEIAEDIDASVRVDSDEKKIKNLDLVIPEDVSAGNNYAIFARVEEENGDYYNEDYIKVDLIRNEHEVVIEKIEVAKEVYCGDLVDIKVKLKNTGSNDEDVYITLTNSKLKIDIKSEGFVLEKYGGDDTVTKTFKVEIPDVKKGEYNIGITAFGVKSVSSEVKLVVDCEDKIKSNPSALNLAPLKIPKENDFNFKALFLVWGVLAFAGLIAVFLVIGYFKFRK